MKLKQAYGGTHFPCYYYEPNLLTLTLCERSTPTGIETVTRLFLLMARAQLDRAILRAGIMPENRDFWFQESCFPDELDVALQFEIEDVYDLNTLCEAREKFDEADFGMVCQMTKSENYGP